jgi:deoxyribonuclease-4
LSARGLPYAEQIGAETVQVFVANPRGWAAPTDDLAGDEAFRVACADRGIGVFVHAPYLCNFASPTELTRERSATAVRHSLQRGARIGAAGVVVHAGSAVDLEHREVALKVMRELVLPLLDDSAGSGWPLLLIEPTAGGGQALAGTVSDLEPLFEALEWHPHLGVCFDTCHALAAGHDVVSPGGMRRTLNALVRAVGRGRLRLVHANDSKDPLGSGRDRHTNIGAGTIGIEPFGELFRHAAVRGVPVIVETPGDVARHRDELATLRELRER